MPDQTQPQTPPSIVKATGVFALLKPKAGVTREQVMTVMPAEIRATVQLSAAGETIQDADKVARNCWHLELAPKNSDAIYAKAEYWVEKDSFPPIKGKFYSDSGRVLKIAYYHRYEKQLGAERPGETIIIPCFPNRRPRHVFKMTQRWAHHGPAATA